MEDNDIIFPQMESNTGLTEQEIQRELDNCNKGKGNAKGKWVYTNDFGIVWCSLEADLMGGTPTPPNGPPPPILREMVEWGKSLDFDTIKENAVLVVKVSSTDPYYAQQLQTGIIDMVLAPRAEMLKAKKLTVLFMDAKDDISLIEEQDMEKAGWQKKDKSIIINPFQR